jgi:glucose-1-phosphate thymidylyltransferase
VLHKVLDPRPFGVAELRPDGTLRRLVEKPRRPRSNLASVGVYFFTAAIYAAVDAIGPSARGELEISHAIQWLVDRGVAVHAVEYCGYWKDVGTVEDALHCNRHLLGRLHPAAAAGAVDAASRVDAQVVVESGARIVRSTVTGPTIVGAGAILEDCRIGPYTSIGRDCVVRACGVRDSILLEGAHVTAVDDLASSIVGRGAVVSRRDRPDGLRLIVGDHTQVDLAR